jgi:hypothetical protein
LWGGGITLASSDHAVVANNTLSGNCNGITGTQQTRPDGNPGLLEDANIHDNVIIGPGGKTGVGADNGANLDARHRVLRQHDRGPHVLLDELLRDWVERPRFAAEKKNGVPARKTHTVAFRTALASK